MEFPLWVGAAGELALLPQGKIQAHPAVLVVEVAAIALPLRVALLLLDKDLVAARVVQLVQSLVRVAAVVQVQSARTAAALFLGTVALDWHHQLQVHP
jgi:hypothetical protein